ncbi:3-dehydroquinate dehydratase [bioreactor metagenome]|uniref:3-dehydroquinate dehydratase n=1 Tax=bioreactor metagenome TaxID=1076179 RepID=A0A645HXD5_9ZZZZ
MLSELRKILGELPLLFTFRTTREGGKKDLETIDYIELNKAAVTTDMIDLIDVEAFTGDDFVQSVITEAHKHKVLVIVSNHDFEKTPSKEEIISRLRLMQRLGADISKIAVMPSCLEDVLTLLTATVEMNEKYAEGPIITMSMSKLGSISRISGEYFGSAITFGSAKKASAPGQMEAKDLNEILGIIHNNL